MAQHLNYSASEEELLEELNAVKAKLNEQKKLIEQLTHARDTWKWRATGGGTGLAITSVRHTGVLDERREYDATYVPRVRAAVLRGALGQLSETLRPGRSYRLRITDVTLPSDDLFAAPRYQVEIMVWEGPDIGTAPNNT